MSNSSPKTMLEWLRDISKRVRALETRRSGGGSTPAGLAIAWGGDAVPDWLLEAKGQTLLIEEYPQLFAAIGTIYGGDGVTTFKAPDWRKRALVGLDASDTDFNTVGKTGGAKTHSHTEGDLAAASGAVSNDAASIGYQAVDRHSRGPASTSAYSISASGKGGANSFNHYTKVYGTTAAASSMDPYAVVRWCITVGGPRPVFSPSAGVGTSQLRGTTAQRDAHWGVPTTNAERAMLANLRPSWFNTDTGCEEAYLASIDVPGLVARGVRSTYPSQWYPISGALPRARYYKSGGVTSMGAPSYTTEIGFLENGLVTDPALPKVGHDEIEIAIPGLYRIGGRATASIAANFEFAIWRKTSTEDTPVAKAYGPGASASYVDRGLSTLYPAAMGHRFRWRIQAAGAMSGVCYQDTFYAEIEYVGPPYA